MFGVVARLVNGGQGRGQVGGQGVIPLCFVRTAEQFIGLAHVQIKGGVEGLNTAVSHGVCPVEGDLIPVEPLFRTFLMAGDVVGGDTGLEVVLGGCPGLLVEGAGLVNLPPKLSLSALNA